MLLGPSTTSQTGRCFDNEYSPYFWWFVFVFIAASRSVHTTVNTSKHFDPCCAGADQFFICKKLQESNCTMMATCNLLQRHAKCGSAHSTHRHKSDLMPIKYRAVLTSFNWNTSLGMERKQDGPEARNTVQPSNECRYPGCPTSSHLSQQMGILDLVVGMAILFKITWHVLSARLAKL
jgi:hypothetical protein